MALGLGCSDNLIAENPVDFYLIYIFIFFGEQTRVNSLLIYILEHLLSVNPHQYKFKVNDLFPALATSCTVNSMPCCEWGVSGIGVSNVMF